MRVGALGITSEGRARWPGDSGSLSLGPVASLVHDANLVISTTDLGDLCHFGRPVDRLRSFQSAPAWRCSLFLRINTGN